MTIDNTTVSVVMAFIASIGLFLDAIVHWDKVRHVLCSSVAIAAAEAILLFSCYFLGRYAIIAGANIYLVINFFDFIRSGDNSCGRIGFTVLTAALGAFTFAVQFALVVKGV